MKNKKLTYVSVAMAAAMALSVGVLSACGGNDDAKAGDRTRITFYPAAGNQSVAMRKLVNDYNEGQGKLDGVYVIADYTQVDSSSNHYSMCPDNVENVADVLTVSDRYLFYGAGYSSGSFYADLSALYANEELRTKDSDGKYVLDLDIFAEDAINRFYYNRDTLEAGDMVNGTLYALPYCSNPTFLMYNRDYFEKENINIISVKEDELDSYNTANGTKFAPRGYCEYTVDATPKAGLKTSENLDGKTVVKVFNNLVPMNYIELNTLAKNFTKEGYNSSSPSKYGFLNEWWFSHGWPVGGNSVAWSDAKQQHVFALGDRNQSYMVVKDVTIDGKQYSSGDVLGYNARKFVAANKEDSSKVDMSALYALPTQYEQFRDFCALSQQKGKAVDSDMNGYGISPDPNSFAQSSKTKYFTTGQVAMLVEGFNALVDIKKMTKANIDAAPLYTYREFEGEGQQGSDKLQIVGENGFTGKLKEVEGTIIKTQPVGSADNVGYAIPSNSSKKEAAFKFMQFLCSEKGQKYLVETSGGLTPTAKTYALDESFSKQQVKLVDNYAAIGMMSVTDRIGDWSYCGDKEWIIDWSLDLNGPVRNGAMTLDTFFKTWTAKIDDGAEGYTKNLKQNKYQKIRWVGLR